MKERTQLKSIKFTSNNLIQDHTGHTSINKCNNTQLSGGSDLSTHDTLCCRKQQKGKQFITQVYGLNATIIALNNPGLTSHSTLNNPPNYSQVLIGQAHDKK